MAPLTRRWRLELSGSSGVSAYESYPAYGHVLARARLHLAGSAMGIWAGASAGRSFSADTVLTPAQIAVGTWLARARLGGGLSIQRRSLADSVYLDIVGSARLRDPHFELEATIGARPWSRGPPEGVYGEMMARLPLTPAVALLVTGGRYPADPVRGVIGARYVSVAIRLATTGARARVAPMASLSSVPDVSNAELEPPALVARPFRNGRWSLRIRIPDASRVELSADFTDWQVVDLEQVQPGVWQLTTPLAPGVYRVNLRIDGGDWIVPEGTRRERDDFGGAVGILVIRD